MIMNNETIKKICNLLIVHETGRKTYNKYKYI